MAGSPGGQPPRIFLPQSARDLIELYFGTQIRTKQIPSDVTVGTTASQLGTYAHQRTQLIIGNTGSALVVIAFSPSVTVTTGLPLQANTGLSFNWFDDGEMIFDTLYAISGTAGQTVHVIESVLGFA